MAQIVCVLSNAINHSDLTPCMTVTIKNIFYVLFSRQLPTLFKVQPVFKVKSCNPLDTPRKQARCIFMTDMLEVHWSNVVKLVTNSFPFFQAAEKMQGEVFKILLDLDSSLRKVKDKHGRIPRDLVPSSFTELQNILQPDSQHSLPQPNLDRR